MSRKRVPYEQRPQEDVVEEEAEREERVKFVEGQLWDSSDSSEKGRNFRTVEKFEEL